MKNQIILVSRIYEREEFSIYNNENDDPRSAESENTRVVILQGYGFFKEGSEKSVQEAAEILRISERKGIKKDETTLIAYHDKKRREKAFEGAVEEEGWTALERIETYGSEGNPNHPLYENILRPLGRAIKAEDKNEQSKFVEALWEHFHPKPIDEIKQDLLFECIFPENKPKLEDVHDDLKIDYQSFEEEIKKKFGSNEITFNNEDYIDALKNLRIKLLGS